MLIFQQHFSTDCHRFQYLVDVMVVHDAVEALVDVIEHVHHLHGRAVLAQGGEAHNVAEVNRHLIVELRFHHAGLLQALHHRPTEETDS